MQKTLKNWELRDDTVRIVAEITGYSTDTVKKVRQGIRDNDEVMANLIDWGQAKKKLVGNLKAKQDLYWQAQKTGKDELISQLEEEIDAIQAAYQELFTRTLSKFAARICA
jgi:predicted translin family RNA/ssDNA-binding protein